MGTLYVAGVPAGDPDDLTYRARRVLGSVRLWVAADPARARSRLAGCDVGEPRAGTRPVQDALPALAEGDVALVVDGARPAPGDEGRWLVGEALAHGFPVVPVPGPAQPLTALIVSGLPGDSFIYLGELPEAEAARTAVIKEVADERRTLVFSISGEVARAAGDLHDALGDRPLVIVAGGGFAQSAPWRGTLAGALDAEGALAGSGDYVLVVGGSTEEPSAWDEARLAAAIARRVARGEGAKEISQALADVSGWSRREIYRRASEGTGTRPDW